MKIIVEEGCYGTNIDIDNQNFDSLDSDDQLKIISYVFDKLKEQNDQKNLLYDLLRLIESDEYDEDDEPCDQCFTYFFREVYNL